jgi:hypothetical protein
MVTKMVTNTGPRAGIERDGTARAADFRNTNQHLSGQNETGRNDYQQISSAVLSTGRPEPVVYLQALGIHPAKIGK